MGKSYSGVGLSFSQAYYFLCAWGDFVGSVLTEVGQSAGIDVRETVEPAVEEGHVVVGAEHRDCNRK